MKLAYVLICSALLTAFFVGLRFMVYGFSKEFGLGFALGGLVIGMIVAVGAHYEYRGRQ